MFVFVCVFVRTTCIFILIIFTEDFSLNYLVSKWFVGCVEHGKMQWAADTPITMIDPDRVEHQRFLIKINMTFLTKVFNTRSSKISLGQAFDQDTEVGVNGVNPCYGVSPCLAMC